MQDQKVSNIINIYTDGACSKNPGPGGWACVVFNPIDKIVTDCYTQEEEETTNNRMEIEAILMALELAITKYKDKVCLIWSDSAYCVNMFNEWIVNWAKNNWTNSSKEVVKNFDLVQKLWIYKQIEFPNFSIAKISGHVGELGNELADAYATAARFPHDASKLVKIIKENGITLEIE